MRWALDGFARLWNALLGRDRIPRDHDELWRLGGKTGTEVGRLEAAQRGGGGQPPGSTLVEHPPAEQIVGGVVAARIASIGQRLARRFNRILARARRRQLKGDWHLERAMEFRGQRPDVEPESRGLDPLVAQTLVYLLSFGLVVLTLESAGMWTSLAAYDGSIGSIRIPMSLAAGAILALAGHGAGHLIETAIGERVRPGRLAGAAAVLLVGVLAVVWLGTGRDANTEAADRFRQVGTLEGNAAQLDRRARDLLEPLPALGEEVPALQPSTDDRRAAADLNRRAEDLRRKAERVDAEARDGRTLGFFALVQILGLAVGAVGGFFFAGAAPVREDRRLSRKANRADRRASRHRSRAAAWQAKADDIAARVGRLVKEELAWGSADLGHHEQARLIARGFVATPAGPAAFPSDEEVAELVKRALKPADLNGAGEGRFSKSKKGD